MAMKGRDEEWGEENYTANFAGRHVKQKTSALYAKNPKAVAKRVERMDYAVWDENPQSLSMAMQIMQQAVMAQEAGQRRAARDDGDGADGSGHAGIAAGL